MSGLNQRSNEQCFLEQSLFLEVLPDLPEILCIWAPLPEWAHFPSLLQPKKVVCAWSQPFKTSPVHFLGSDPTSPDVTSHSCLQVPGTQRQGAFGWAKQLVTVLARVRGLMPGEPSWAMGRGIRLYIGTALLYQARPHPDPHRASRQKTFILFLEAGVVRGHPAAKWHGLYLWALVQVLGPRALIWVALRGPSLLPMSPGCHQEELGVTRRATATGSCASMNLFEPRLGALSETPQRTVCISWPCLVIAKLARIDEDDQEGAILVRE